MSKPDDGAPIPLPEELDRALHRASDRSLSALTSLRKAVLQHVQDARSRGATLSEIKPELQELIARLQSSAGAKNGGGREELAAQVTKWTDGFYNRRD